MPMNHVLPDPLPALDALGQAFPHWREQFEKATTREELRRVIRRLFTAVLDELEGPKPSQQTLREKLHLFLLAELHRGPSLQSLATYLGYSSKYSSTLFRQVMGEGFSTYLRRLRLERATRLLREASVPVASVAGSVGFQDVFAFSHFFKRWVGCSPSEYRRKAGGPQYSLPTG